jgi:hypothetical protein
MTSFACLLVLAASSAAPAPDTVVVCPPHFTTALQPWIEHRKDEGHRLALVSNMGTPEQIRAQIRSHARQGGLRYIVLVGDAEPAAYVDPGIRARCVPTHMANAVVNVRWKSPPKLATDNWYADLDGNRIPDVAIGRLPADSPQELTELVNKILTYEKSLRPGSWCQRINFVAGVGGFGPLLDPLLEMATRKFLTDGIPAEYETSMTYGSWRSPFCPDPYSFHAMTVNRFNEGCLFWVYIGHGYPYQLDRVRVPGKSFHIFSTRDVGKLDGRLGPPIAIFLACYTGAFDQPADCLAEEMLRAPGGPVAVLAGSRVTMPYAMSVLGSGLMDEYFQHRTDTIGEVLLRAKQRMVASEPTGTNRKLLDLVASAVSPDALQLEEERFEHVAMFNLLGDPLLRLYYPDSVELEVDDKVTAGAYLAIRGTSPITGRATVELVCPRDQSRNDVPPRRKFDSSVEALTRYNVAYQNANDHRWSVRQIEVQGDEFLTAIPVPVEARGQAFVRVLLENGSQRRYALGSKAIHIEAPKSHSAPAKARLEDATEIASPVEPRSELRR